MIAFTAVPLALAVLTVPASASGGDVYQQLADLNPGTTAAEMKAEATAYATKEKRTPEAVAAEALAEAQKSAGTVTESTTLARASSSGGGDKNKNLPSAYSGDIFWWDSTTDHVGLYRSGTEIVHAPGLKKTVEIRAAKGIKAPTKTQLMMVNTKNDGATRISYTQRKAAADWAATKKGKKYNSNFAFNKKINSSKYNCSQLVWAAWKGTAKIDLDNGISKGVYPGDIRSDRRTHVYKKSI